MVEHEDVQVSRSNGAALPTTRRDEVLLQNVFDDLAVFDDDGQVFGGIGEQAQIFEGVSVDEENIGPRALGDHSERCLPVGITFAGKAEEFGISGGEHP